MEDTLLSYFLADPIGPLLSVPHLVHDPRHPLHDSLRRYLASVPSDDIARIRHSPDFDSLYGDLPTERAIDMAREWVVIEHLSSIIPARRLQTLVTSSARPVPYAHQSLADLAVSGEGMVPLRAFNYDGSVLERNGFCFLPAPATEGPNSAHWLLQHLCQPDVREVVWLRLDPFMFGSADTFPRARYLMRVYGRPLDWDRLAQLCAPEHGRWLPDGRTQGVEFTDFVWERRNNEVHFICEELPRSSNVHCRGARYLHAIYGLDARLVTHLDGALRIYSADELDQRRGRHVRHAGKAGTRVKLFRLDHPIPRERLADIAASFFVWNHDVVNYFDRTA